MPGSYARSTRSLNDKCINTGYGEPLNMDDRVGDFFDDRGTTKEVPITSIVLVPRDPPDPAELRDLQRIQRFGSLMPGSAARPPKRLLPDALQRRQGGIELLRGETPNRSGKRQRTPDMRPEGTLNPDQPILSREGQVEGHYPSQVSTAQGSIHQIMDSQRSPEKQRTLPTSETSYAIILLESANVVYVEPNPYGTPKSLSLISPQDQIQADQIYVSTIPDSPPSRGSQAVNGAFRTIIDFDREITKSESPELRLSLDEVPPQEQEGAPVEHINGDVDEARPDSTSNAAAVDQKYGDIHMGQSSVPAFVSTSTSEPSSIKNLVDEFVSTSNGGERQKSRTSGTTSRTPLKRKQTCVDTTFGEQARRGSDDDVYDPIESDSDSFCEKQRMHSVKRLKLNHTTPGCFVSPRMPLALGKDRNEGEFLEESFPVSRDNRVRAPLRELPVPGHDNIETQHDDTLNQEENGLDQLRNAVSKQQRQEECAVKVKSDISQYSSQATTAGSQDSENDTKASQKPTQDKRSEGSESSERDENGEARSLTNGVPAQDAGRDAETGRAEELAEAHRASQAKTNEEEIAEAKRLHETKAKAKQLANERETAERRAQEHHAREKALSEQAEKMMLAADSAKHLEAEKLEKRKAQAASKHSAVIPVESKPIAATPRTPIPKATAPTNTKPISATSAEADPKGAIPANTKTKDATPGETELHAKAPAVTDSENPALSEMKFRDATSAKPKKRTYIPRTDQDKARRKELDIQRLADRAKAAEEEKSHEGKRAYKRAQANAKEVQQEVEKSSKNVNPEGEEKTLKKQSTPMLEQTFRKFRETSDDRSRQSSTPSDLSSVAGQSRKTMTPALPRSSVTKSSSNQGEMITSSPLAAKSAKNLERPLRSALKQGSSALRRSVSFMDGLEDNPGPKNGSSPSPIKTDSNTARNRPFKSLLEINREILSGTPTQSKSLKSTSATNGSGSQAAKTSGAKKEMIQMKLNITRNVKGKDRVINPPIPAEPISKQEIEDFSSTSEDSVSSFLPDEEVWPNGSSKAGPSSKKSAQRMKSSLEEVAAKSDPSDALIDPEIHKIKVEMDTTATPALPARLISRSVTSYQQASTSRSPAQAMRGTTSLSSDSADDSDTSKSDSSEESGSSSEEDSDNEPNGNTAPKINNGSSKVVKVLVLSPKATPVAQSSQDSSSSKARSQTNASMNSHVKRIDQGADKRLQGEFDQYVPNDSAQTPATGKNSAQEKPAPPTYPKLDRHGTHPAYYRYPKLSELKKTAEAESIYDVPTYQTTAPIATGDDETESSSSEDEESNSDDEKAADGSQTGSKSNSGHIPGLRGVMKRKFPLKATEDCPNILRSC